MTGEFPFSAALRRTLPFPLPKPTEDDWIPVGEWPTEIDEKVEAFVVHQNAA